MKTRNRLSDKYDRGGYIEPIPGLYDGLLFTFRPMLPESVEDHLVAVDQQTQGRARILATAKKIAEQLKTWSEWDGNAPLAINTETVKDLPYPMLMRLVGIVTGRQASDLPPGVPDNERLTEFVAAKLAEAQGRSPGQDQLANDQKN